MADSECTGDKMTLMTLSDEEKHGDNTSFELNKLCDELKVEILIRLPTKSAVQSKLVCKKWYSLISSPSFISQFNHIRRHKHVHSSLLLQFIYVFNSTHDSEFQIISDGSLLRNLYGENAFHLTYLPCPPQDLRLEGSVDDLILCSYRNLTTKETIYYVSNLLTRQWVSLPPPPAPDEGFSSCFSIGFLTYDLHKFMLVRLHSNPISQFKVQVFSSEDFKWKTLAVSVPVSSSLALKPHVLDTTLVAYKGMLHWLNSDSDCIVVYDPRNNNPNPNTFSRIIHLPVHLPLLFHLYGCFGVSQGNLRVAIIPSDGTVEPILDVWELEDYESGLWNLVYKVNLKNLIHNESELSPLSALSLHPGNSDVICLRLTNGAVLLNMKTRIIEGVYRLNKNVRFSWLNTFYVADQWWPTTVSSLH